MNFISYYKALQQIKKPVEILIKQKPVQQKTVQREIAELILSNSDKILIYDHNINLLLSEIKKLPEEVLIMDLHDTLDLFKPDFQFNLPVICCSWVGYGDSGESMRFNARKDIKERINTKQIQFGVMVFQRGDYIKKTDDRATTTKKGSKAWFVNLFKTKKVKFFDDAEDHINSVKMIGATTILVKSIKDIIENL